MNCYFGYTLIFRLNSFDFTLKNRTIECQKKKLYKTTPHTKKKKTEKCLQS